MKVKKTHKVDKKNKKTIKNIKPIKMKKSSINNTKTKKQMEKKCMEKFVKTKIDKFKEENNDTIKKLESTKPMTDKLKDQIIFLKKNNKNYEKMISTEIKLQNCNIGCAGTILESGDPNKLPTKYAKIYKGYNEDLIQNLENSRKKLFGTKTSILDDDSFYEKINKKIKDNYLKQGAVSHCSIYK